MSRKKLKRNDVKKKSERAEAMRQEQLEEEKKQQKKAELKKKQQKTVMNTLASTMFPLYGLASALLSFLLNRIGVFSAVGIVLAILGIRRTSGKKDRLFWVCIIDIVMCVMTGILFVLYLLGYARSAV